MSKSETRRPEAIGRRLRRSALLGVWLGASAGGCYSGRDDASIVDTAGATATDGTSDPGSSETDGDEPTDDSAGAPEPLCGAEATAPTRLWRLSDAQYANAVADLLDLSEVVAVHTPGTTEDTFVNESELLTVTGALVSQYQTAAEDATAQALAKLDQVVPCDPAMGDQACAAQLVDTLGPRAFRRPLGDIERDELLALYTLGAEESFEQGIAMVLAAVLQSPSFLYRTELGDLSQASEHGIVRLSSYELASALSFFLRNSIPDDDLWAHAVDGSLADPDVYRAEVQRLLSTAEVKANLTRIYLSYLGTAKAASIDKSQELFPGFDVALRESMVEETQRVIAALLQEDGSLTELLTSRRSFVNGALAELYGIAGVTGAEFVEVELPAAERSGVLTHASTMTMLSSPEETSVVHRGLVVQKLLLCAELPPPPPGVDLDDPALEGMTQREMAEYRAGNPSCTGCHVAIDPFGLAFEHYDPIGRYRTELPDGQPVDASGDVPVAGQIADAIEMLAAMAGDARVTECVAEQMTTYALGRKLGNVDQCELDAIVEQFEASGQSLVTPFEAIALSDAFALRRIEP